ncbi:MAG: DUF6340 family protein [Bacteroidales bacterium]
MRGAFLILLVLIITSCRSYTYIEAEVVDPPMLNIPSNYVDILLVDNSPIQPHTEGCQIKIGEKNQKLYQQFDSLSFNLLENTRGIVDSIGIYWSIALYPKKVREDSLYLKERTIDSLQMFNISSEFDPDIVIALTTSRVTSLTNLSQLYGGGYLANSKGEFLTLVEMYDPKLSTIVDKKVDIMPFEFNSADLDYQKALYDVSPEHRVDELVYAKLDRLLPMLLPSRRYVNRMIILSNEPNMRDAYKYTREGNWKYASIIWEHMIEHTLVKSVKLAAFVNLALYYEFESKFDQSITMISKAKGLLKKQQVELSEYLDLYEKELKGRSLTN